jgi:GntR family transcriptional regulator
VLRAEIERGKFGPGQLLPSIADLSQRFQASTITVRRALGLLEDEGLLSIHQGHGSWVNRPRPDEFDPLLKEASRIRDLAISLITRIETLRKNKVSPTS